MDGNIVLFVCEKDELINDVPGKCPVCKNDFQEIEYIKLDVVKPYLDELLVAREYFHFITDRENIRKFKNLKNDKASRRHFEDVKIKTTEILGKWRKSYVQP